LRILLASDAWAPQVNGVVVTLQNTKRELEAAGHKVEVVGPDRFLTLPCPTYPEIRLALWPARALPRVVGSFQPDAVHIATEGPIGIAMRRLCLRRGISFTTSYHTRFPEYLHARTRLPTAWTYSWLRRFHAPAQVVMVSTAAIQDDLRQRGFERLVRWSRGVDTTLFRPAPRLKNDWARPIFMFVGRVAVEKNIGAFLDLDLPGTKVVVGDGPQRTSLQRRFGDTVVFTGAKAGEELAAHFRSADVLVFPSRTDTFGLVLIEAMACGTPVAAYPVPGPLDVVKQGESGMLDEDLRRAALAALELDRDKVLRHALSFSWGNATSQFLQHLRPHAQLESA